MLALHFLQNQWVEYHLLFSSHKSYYFSKFYKSTTYQHPQLASQSFSSSEIHISLQQDIKRPSHQSSGMRLSFPSQPSSTPGLQYSSLLILLDHISLSRSVF